MFLKHRKYAKAEFEDREWRLMAMAIGHKCNIKRGQIKKKYPDECSYLEDDQIEDIYAAKDDEYGELCSLRDKLFNISNNCH